jgi:hypothetical protein
VAAMASAASANAHEETPDMNRPLWHLCKALVDPYLEDGFTLPDEPECIPPTSPPATDACSSQAHRQQLFQHLTGVIADHIM